MDIQLRANVLPDPFDPTRPPYGVDEAEYPRYAFRFWPAGGESTGYVLLIPTDDPNPVMSGPVSYPEQARWVLDLAAVTGLVWEPGDYDGNFCTATAASCFALIDAMLALGLKLVMPTPEGLAADRVERVGDLTGR
ncbi:MAG: hypothetical protein JWM80_2099 [Cyanobacteria bacterium RYN_339]|nr:hypothetical protein [Cyanobacteria bacterium RYN_339]